MKLTNWFCSLFAAGALLVFQGAAAEEVGIVTGANVNVRGEPSLSGEVVTQLQPGDKVVILNEITVEKPGAGEPSKWARIQMPENTPVWVYARFIETNQGVVAVSRLNLRSGPGENHNVIGRLERGATVKPIRVVNEWMEIQTPAAAYGFIAADLVKKGEGSLSPGQKTTPATLATAETPKPKPPGLERAAEKNPPPAIAARVTNEPPVAVKSLPEEPKPEAKAAATNAIPPVPPMETVSKAETNGANAAVAAMGTNAQVAAVTGTNSVVPPMSGAGEKRGTNLPPISAAAETASSGTTNLQPSAATDSGVLPKRVVRREGILRSTFSIQAPTYFELINPDTRKTINYIHTGPAGLKLQDYKGRKITVTGEEGIDRRWPNTPVIEVDTLEISE